MTNMSTDTGRVLDPVEARRRAFIAGFYAARRHPDITAATHVPEFPGTPDASEEQAKP